MSITGDKLKRRRDSLSSNGYERSPARVVTFSNITSDNSTDLDEPNRFIYIFGGDVPPSERGTIERYSLKQNRWEKVDAPMPNSGDGVGVVAHRGRIWLIGGYINENSSRNDVWIFNPVTATWDLAFSMIQERAFLGVVEFKERMYAVGGRSGSEVYATTEVYDDEHGWSECASMNEARYKFGIAVFNGGMIAAGGLGINGTASKTLEYFATQSRQWTLLKSNFLSARHAFGFVGLDNMMYAVGGDKLNSLANVVPSDGSWVRRGFVHGVTRSNIAVTAISGLLYVIGGDNGTLKIRKSDCFHPSCLQWRPLDDMTLARSCAGVAFWEQTPGADLLHITLTQ